MLGYLFLFLNTSLFARAEVRRVHEEKEFVTFHADMKNISHRRCC